MRSNFLSLFSALFSLIFICMSCGPLENATRIACVGDSITFGSGIRFNSWRSYPAQLQKKLGRDFQVENFGKSGATLLEKGDLSYRVQKEFEEARNFAPDIVIIKLGTNDSKAHNWVHNKDFYSDYLSLISLFKTLPSQPRIIICKPVPVFTDESSIKKEIVRDELLPLLDEISKDAQVELLDLYRPFINQSSVFPDGIHPNAAGAKMIAAHVAQYLTTN